MDEAIEELIREVAAKHGIALGRDDPIFVLQTINHRLLQNSAGAQQAMLDRYKEELALIAQAWSNDAKSKAERVLNAAMSASKELMDQGARTTRASVHAEINAALGRVDWRLHHCRSLAVVNLVCSAVTLIAAGLTLWAILHH
ncbi:MAG: conjugal transfer protein TraM [Betaproteobacteria bacterium]